MLQQECNHASSSIAAAEAELAWVQQVLAGHRRCHEDLAERRQGVESSKKAAQDKRSQLFIYLENLIQEIIYRKNVIEK